MSINSKFSVAVHTMLLIEVAKGEITSALMAGSVNTNPVVIRKTIGLLKKNNLLIAHQGKSTYEFTKTPAEITLLDIYKAVSGVEADKLFNLHDSPNVNCPVGAAIQLLLESILVNAQEAMEAVLGGVSVQDLLNKMEKL